MQQVNLPSGIQVHKLRENTFLKIINSPWEGISFIFFFNLEASDTHNFQFVFKRFIITVKKYDSHH